MIWDSTLRNFLDMRNIIVIGGSAGSMEPLCTLLEQLPADLPAAVFVVIHIAEQVSRLSTVLERRASLCVLSPKGGERVQRGHVYVAPPARHLLLNDGHVEVQNGPRENRHRPSIDV